MKSRKDSPKRLPDSGQPHVQTPPKIHSSGTEHAVPRRRSTGSLLPSLRILFRPTPGIGLDAYMPFNKQFRLFMALESYFGTTSTVNFGIEPVRFPFLRLQCAPELRVIVRLPLLRVTEFNRLYMGSQLTLFQNGQRPKIDTTDFGEFWNGIKKFIKPITEIQRNASLGGMLLNKSQRRTLRDILEQSRVRRQIKAKDQQRRREKFQHDSDARDPLHNGNKSDITDLSEILKHRYHKRLQLDREMDPPSLPEHEFGPGAEQDGDNAVKDSG